MPPSSLVVDEQKVEDFIGQTASSLLVSAKIFREAKYDVSPVVAIEGDRKTVVAGAYDAAAFAVAPPSFPVVIYGDYATWRRLGGPSFADQVRRVVGDARLEVDPKCSVSRYRALAASGSVGAAPAPAQPVRAYRVALAAVEEQQRRTRDADAAALDAFVSRLRYGPELREITRTTSRGLAALDALAAASNLGCVFISSPLTAEMVTGLPAASLPAGFVGAVATPGEADVVIASVEPIDLPELRAEESFPTLAAMLASFSAGGAVGVQETSLDCGTYLRLADAGLHLADATAVLQRWDERLAEADLAYYIAAAHGALAGVARASAHIAQRSVFGLTEAEAARAFREGVRDFATANGIPGRLSSYFEIIHSGERTVLPAIAAEVPLPPSSQTIKFDMGLLMHDGRGCVRACSDVARTLSPLPEVRAAHAALQRELLENFIPRLRPGVRGDEAHAAGVDALAAATAEIRAAELIPETLQVRDYGRDCGHSLQRQTAVTVHFIPGSAGRLEAGMLGCAEFVLSHENRVLAVEEEFYVGAERTMPITL